MSELIEEHRTKKKVGPGPGAEFEEPDLSGLSQVTTLHYDAAAIDTHQAVLDKAFAFGPVDLVISAAGILAGQEVLDDDPLQAGLLVETNFTGHVTTLLGAAARLRAQGHGTIVVLSSVAGEDVDVYGVHVGVSIGPGLIELTRIPLETRSADMVLAMFTTAALVS